MCLCVCERLL
uniref:Uncharacterized protein n=1 Tax=Anguilla anguilla TaxID=7936 RepID=A0A0E9T6H9_ANGAN